MEHAGPSIHRMSVYCHFTNCTHSFIGGLRHVININLKVKSKIVIMYVDFKVVRGMKETLKEIPLTAGHDLFPQKHKPSGRKLSA